MLNLRPVAIGPKAPPTRPNSQREFAPYKRPKSDGFKVDVDTSVCMNTRLSNLGSVRPFFPEYGADAGIRR